MSRSPAVVRHYWKIETQMQDVLWKLHYTYSRNMRMKYTTLQDILLIVCNTNR